jgi:NADPH:quinone reductase-like Zn-dependent oxidoreductase
MEDYQNELIALGQNIFDLSEKDLERAKQTVQFINGMLEDKDIRKKIPEVVALAETHKGNKNGFIGALMGEFMIGNF